MGGLFNRINLENIEYIRANPVVMDIFAHVCWIRFLERFQGSNTQLELEFSQTFDGNQAIVS
jgi:hypothetical protein